MKRFLNIISLFIVCFISLSFADAKNNLVASGKVYGIIKDTKTSQPIAFATIAVLHVKDSSAAGGVTTDDNGNFKIESLPFGNYYLKISFVGYSTVKTEVFSLSAVQPEKNFGEVKLKSSASILKEITIEDKQIRVEQKGDTIQYNASAFKTQPDANAEDLVTKMPGVTTDSKGNVTAHGEQVKQVLVDGKQFFGDDPSMALKNLPAEVIDKIQIFDKMSDQSQFTGFDDGQSTKTMNITTRQGKSNGQFGKMYIGYGTDDRYIVGGNLNFFKGDRRISVLGLFNNVNQQNFSTQDILGALGTSGGGGYGGGGGRGGRGGGGGGGYGGGGATNNFLVGQQNGIATTDALGLNYSDKWGKKINISGSYFLNIMNTTDNQTSLTRTYITARDSGLHYNEDNQSRNKNTNHRFNLRFEYKMDSLNSLLITPKLNLQQNTATIRVQGNNTSSESIMESSTDNKTTSNNLGYNFSNNILFQHKFQKKGRTFSLNLGTTVNNKNGDGTLYSLSKYYSPNDSVLLDQRLNQYTDGYTLSTNITYTEPIDSNNQFQFSYSPSFTNNKADKETNNFSATNQNYSQLDTLLSNKYTNTYFANRGGISYHRNGKKYNFQTGVDFQQATLSGDQQFPIVSKVNYPFNSVLPMMRFNYKFSKGTNLRIMYYSNTNTPSAIQLQNVINNSNPLLLSVGNPDLKQTYEHTFITRYGRTRSEKATGLFAFLFANFTQDYIGNSSFIANKDTLLNKEIKLNKGSQLTKPVNLQGYFNMRSFVTYALPISTIKSTLNFNTGFSYNRTPALINNETNLADNYTTNGGLGLSSNISEDFDFSVNYSANYNMVKNTLQTQSDNISLNQAASFKLNVIFWKKLVLNTSMNYTAYTGLSQGFNQNFMLWNAAIAYKLLKNNALEIRASVFDLLNQNKSINRSVTETYIEDNRTNVLNRYYMLTLTYNLKNFKSAPVNNEEEHRHHD